jgi:hypothetical protein
MKVGKHAVFFTIVGMMSHECGTTNVFRKFFKVIVVIVVRKAAVVLCAVIQILAVYKEEKLMIVRWKRNKSISADTTVQLTSTQYYNV